jgi:hypothetical protein
MTQEDALSSLRAAYDAANAALEKAQDAGADPKIVARLNDAADLALRSLAQAMKETLTVANQHTVEIQAELDKNTAQLKADLKSDQALTDVIGTVDQVVKLAAALASAFA